MMSLVANSGHKCILEGVETGDQVDRLKQHGARFLQGYYFNRPMSGEALNLLARKGAKLATNPLAA
jgi:EAL domain-containing protein (putative c-di-GMP-specific phosphodiesterase class I)